MRVLHLGKFFHPSHGGIETFLVDLTQAAHAQGVGQALLVHAEHRGQNTGQKDLENFPYLNYFDRVAKWGSLGYAPISPGFPGALNRALEEFRPDVLHLHMPNPSNFWVLANPKARQLPWIVQWQADAAAAEFPLTVRGLYPIYSPFEKSLLRAAKAVIVASPAYLESSRALSRWKEKCHIIPLGLNPQRLSGRDSVFAESVWGDDGRLRLLGLGRLTSYKGFDRLIKASTHTKAKVVIAGDGENRAKLGKMIDDLGLSGRISLLGAVSDEERNGLLRSCDLVCLPSLNRAEAFGISVLEGMAAGKPAVVSNIGGSGLPWLVIDQETGWHVPPGNVEHLAQQINHLDQNRQLLSAAGEKARHRFDQHFHIAAVADKISSLQHQLVKNVLP